MSTGLFHHAEKNGWMSENVPRRSAAGRRIDKAKRTSTATNAAVAEMIRSSELLRKQRETEMSSWSQVDLSQPALLQLEARLRNRANFTHDVDWYEFAMAINNGEKQLLYANEPNSPHQDKYLRCGAVERKHLTLERTSRQYFAQDCVEFTRLPAPENLQIDVTLAARLDNGPVTLGQAQLQMRNPLLDSTLGYQHVIFKLGPLLLSDKDNIHDHAILRAGIGLPFFMQIGLQSYKPRGLSDLVDELERKSNLSLAKKPNTNTTATGNREFETTREDVLRYGDVWEIDRFRRLLWLHKFGLNVQDRYPGEFDRMLSYAKQLNEFIRNHKLQEQKLREAKAKERNFRLWRRNSIDTTRLLGHELHRLGSHRRRSSSSSFARQRNRSLSVDSGASRKAFGSSLAQNATAADRGLFKVSPLRESIGLEQQRDSRNFRFDKAMRLSLASTAETSNDLTRFFRSCRLAVLKDFRTPEQLHLLPGGDKLIQLQAHHRDLSAAAENGRTKAMQSLLLRNRRELKFLQALETVSENQPVKRPITLRLCLFGKRKLKHSHTHDGSMSTLPNLTDRMTAQREEQAQLQDQQAQQECEERIAQHAEESDLIFKLLGNFHQRQKESLRLKNRRELANFQQEHRVSGIQWIGLVKLFKWQFRGIPPDPSSLHEFHGTINAEKPNAMNGNSDKQPRDLSSRIRFHKLIAAQCSACGLLTKRQEKELLKIRLQLEEERDRLLELYEDGEPNEHD